MKKYKHTERLLNEKITKDYESIMNHLEKTGHDLTTKNWADFSNVLVSKLNGCYRKGGYDERKKRKSQ